MLQEKRISFIASITYCLLLLFVTVSSLIMLYSCGASGPKKQTVLAISADSILLPEPVPLSAANKQYYYEGCKRWYDSALLRGGFNGGVIASKNGNIIFEAYHGTGHLPGKDTITETTPFHIASVSKTFTAMSVLKLWQDGKLNIDDEFSKYFPSFNYPGVTVRTLLNHRSGLPNYVYFMEQLGWDKSKFVKNEDVLNWLINRKAELTNISSPNTHFTYCNTNYALLALLIEKVTGEKYAAFLAKTFLVPLGMQHTFVFDTAKLASVIPSYDWRNRLMSFNFLDAVYGDKNIYTTPRDLLIWDRALRSGKFFTAATLEQAYAPYSNEKAGIRNYGLGWRMNNYPSGKKMIYHNGWWHGNNAAFVRLLADTVTIIVVSNKFNRAVYHAKEMASVFGNYEDFDEEDEALQTKDSTTINKKNLLAPNKQTPPAKKKVRIRSKSRQKRK
jgi:CubicO group peptidase (beta-lactamase class C family)